MYEESPAQRDRRKMFYARYLRTRQTKAEVVLWQALRNRKCAGMKFRRQAPLKWFVVDFLCVQSKLIIEIDGGIHESQVAYDREREDLLRNYNYAILRFTNRQILFHLEATLSVIAAFADKQPTQTLPLSRRG